MSMDLLTEELKAWGRWAIFAIIIVGSACGIIPGSHALVCIIGLGVWTQLACIAKELHDMQEKHGSSPKEEQNSL